jgi:hypothetical protein
MFQRIRQPHCFRLRHLAAPRRQAVIPAAFVVIRSGGPLILSKLGDQALLEHPLDRAVERSGAQPQLSTRSGGDILHDCIAVLVASGQRDEDVKDLRREWKQVRYWFLSIRAHTPKYTASQYNVNRYRVTFLWGRQFCLQPPFQAALSGHARVFARGRAPAESRRLEFLHFSGSSGVNQGLIGDLETEWSE